MVLTYTPLISIVLGLIIISKTSSHKFPQTQNCSTSSNEYMLEIKILKMHYPHNPIDTMAILF